MRLLSEAKISGKRVFVRADLDVPLGSDSSFEVATRLNNLKPTIDLILKRGAEKVIVAGHIDRPERPDPKLSTAQLLSPLEAILLRSVAFKPHLQTADDPLDRSNLTGPIFLLENLRFWKGEVENQIDFAKNLANLADIYINEAFGNCHRKHASMVLLPTLIPSYAGVHLQQEVETLSKLLKAPARPFIAIVGGAKIETKLPVIENLSRVADWVLVGGELPIEIKKKKQRLRDNILIATLIQNDMDINDESISRFKELISSAKTVIWNGPLGIFEDGYERGTVQIAKAIAQSSVYSVVGGGETTQFLAEKKLLSKFSFVSAGGGAMLEFLAGKKLPALEALGAVNSK